MTENNRPPVLILGGTGVVGRATVRTLRQLYPDLPIAIAARNQGRCSTLAREIEHAEVAQVDLGRADLGLAPDAQYSAVVAVLKENTLNPLRYAQGNSLPYISMADGVFEIGPGVARHVHQPASAPIMLAGHWAAGMAALPALHFAKEFKAVHEIKLAAVLDPDDEAGPMAHKDVEELMLASPRPLILDNGTWRWVGEEATMRQVKDIKGADVEAYAMSVIDVASLAAATDLSSIRFDLATLAAGRGSTGPPSHELIIEIHGEQQDGNTGCLRIDIEAPQGVSGLTALGIVVSLERLLGLAGGSPTAPGLYFPEVLVNPEHAMDRLSESGARVHRS